MTICYLKQCENYTDVCIPCGVGAACRGGSLELKTTCQFEEDVLRIELQWRLYINMETILGLKFRTVVKIFILYP